MKRITTFLTKGILVILLLSFLFQNSTEAQCSFTDSQKEADYDAIVALYDSNPGNWFSNSWDELVAGNSCDVCALSGVACDSNGLVKELYINGKNLSNLPPEIGNFSALKSLNIFNNHLETLPPQIGNISNLRSLRASRNELSALPSTITELLNLELLEIGENQFSSLPDELAELTNLYRLDISENQFSSLPAVITELPISSLLADGNQLTDLPPALGDLNFVVLMLQDNQLTEIPVFFNNFTSLYNLQIRNNNLQCLSADLAPLCDIPLFSGLFGNPINNVITWDEFCSNPQDICVYDCATSPNAQHQAEYDALVAL